MLFFNIYFWFATAPPHVAVVRNERVPMVFFVTAAGRPPPNWLRLCCVSSVSKKQNKEKRTPLTAATAPPDTMQTNDTNPTRDMACHAPRSGLHDGPCACPKRCGTEKKTNTFFIFVFTSAKNESPQPPDGTPWLSDGPCPCTRVTMAWCERQAP